MPKIKVDRRKPPAGWELIEPTLMEIQAKMKDAEREPQEGKRRCEAMWPIFRLHHQRSRYVYDMYFKKKAISRDLYDWCLREGWGDPMLIAKWKKNGYEKLCCLRCIQTESMTFGSTCICRVPKKDLDQDKAHTIECALCGCRGCATGRE